MTDLGVVDISSAVAAASSTGSELGLTADQAIVVHASNRLAVRLLPSDVLARVAPAAHGAAQLEVDLASRLARTDSPVASLDPRVAPRVYERDGFRITFWTFYESQPSRDISPAAYALALRRLHEDLQEVDLTTPGFMDRVAEAEGLVRNLEQPFEFSQADSDLLTSTFATTTRAIGEAGAAERVLHGEPHPGNVLNTPDGPLFIDLETCCRGPVEFDLAHAPAAVADLYPDVDRELLRNCRILVLAMAAAWRFDPEDRLPNGREAARGILAALRSGPPYPALGAISGLN